MGRSVLSMPRPGETELRAIWSEVLGCSTIDEDAGFFDLGGSSILALQLSDRIEEDLSVQVDAVEIVFAPQFSAVAAMVQDRLGTRP